MRDRKEKEGKQAVNKQNDKELKNYIKVCITTILFWGVAHGYRFVNNLHTSDSLVSVFQDDIYWQRSLGRFMQPFTMVFRGTITAPWLILVITLAFFSTAVYLICRLLKIDNIVLIGLITGILVCNVAMTSSVAAFLPWVDIYAVALFLATLGVWFYEKDNIKGYIFGSICFVLCMGFYQAYIDVALALFFIISIIELTDTKEKLTKSVIALGKRFGGLLISGGVYFVVFKLICKLHHVEVASTYNGLSEVGDYTDTSIISLVVGAYRSFFDRLWNPSRFVSTYLLGRSVSDGWTFVLRLCTILCVLFVIVGIIYLNVKNKTSVGSMLLQTIGLVTFPFAVNFVYFLSKGMEHDLMIFSFFFVFVFAIVVPAKVFTTIEKKKFMWVCLVPLLLIIWNNIVYSNQIYFKIDMEDRAALSTVTRLVSDIEDIDEYEPGVTPVVFIGGLEESASKVIYLRELEIYGNGTTPFNYGVGSLMDYIEWYLNVPMNISEMKKDEPIAQEMSIYPSKNSMKYEDGVVYVKLSD